MALDLDIQHGGIKWYKLSLDPHDALQTDPVKDAKPTAEVEDLRYRFIELFETIRARIPAAPTRAIYAGTILLKAKAALENGDLQHGKEYLDNYDFDLLKIRYFKAHIANGELHLAPMEWMENPTPPAVQALVNRLQKAIAKIKFLFFGDKKIGEKTNKNRDKFDRLMTILQSYAQHGLQEGRLADATSALASFEDQFVAEEGPRIREIHLRRTIRTAIIITVIGLGLLLASVHSAFPAWLNPILPEVPVIKTVVEITIGMCLGVVFFAFIRNLDLTFDTLGNFDRNQLLPWLRFALVGVVTAIFCILLKAGLVELQINQLNLNEYLGNIYAALVVGMICGYSDAAITKLLTGVLDRK